MLGCYANINPIWIEEKDVQALSIPYLDWKQQKFRAIQLSLRYKLIE